MLWKKILHIKWVCAISRSNEKCYTFGEKKHINILCGSDGKEFSWNEGDLGLISELGRTPGEWQPTPVFLPGESPWTEKPGGLQSMGSQRVGHDWATKHCIMAYKNPEA